MYININALANKKWLFELSNQIKSGYLNYLIK